ncbi:MAG: hypothetical protein U9Q07_00865 [Planctomycetota bacterium]|nr:hypothetical protein [Planctomycetota bacterium]
MTYEPPRITIIRSLKCRDCGATDSDVRSIAVKWPRGQVKCEKCGGIMGVQHTDTVE